MSKETNVKHTCDRCGAHVFVPTEGADRPLPDGWGSSPKPLASGETDYDDQPWFDLCGLCYGGLLTWWKRP